MLSKRPNETTRDRGPSSRSFAADDRAIEGLPIRLVIALVVGVATLGIMLNILGGIGDFGDTEVTVELGEDVIETSDTNDAVTVDVVDENGNSVPDSTVIATAGNARLDGAVTEHTGADDNSADLDLSDADLRPDQASGTITIEIQPPGDSNYVDEQQNPEILVVDS